MGCPDLTGNQVGPYLLTSIIGSGSAAKVYCAVDTESEDSRTFAVKCLSKKKITRRRKHQLVAELVNHDEVTGCPHVLPLCDVLEDESYLLLVLDMCETDMYKAIWKNKVYWRNDTLIRNAFVEVLNGVIACHEKGVYHRDLKPNNLMCKLDGTGIQVGDFGLSTHDRVCKDGGTGSPLYMSPECWTCDDGDPYFGSLIDIWSLGMILFNMVTNQSPWEAALPSDKEYKAFIFEEDHLYHTYPISKSLNELLKRMLNPAPTRRLSLPVIKEAVLEMDTFYKWCPERFDDSARVVFAHPEQTCVNPENFSKGKKRRTTPFSKFLTILRYKSR